MLSAVCYLLLMISFLIAQKHRPKVPKLEGVSSLKAVAFSLLFSAHC